LSDDGLNISACWSGEIDSHKKGHPVGCPEQM
jgi:hypothetical protein